MITRTIVLFLTSLLLWAATATAQNSTLTIQPGFELIVDGTSNIHDWEADATAIEAQLVLSGFDGTLESLTAESFQSLKLVVPVEDLDSGSRGLDRNLRSNLNADDFPTISFELSDISSLEQSGDTLQLTADGVITAAGQPHEIEMALQATATGQGGITFSGTQHLKMTDFNIDPPRALLGTVRATDEFSVIYSVTFAE